MSYIDEAKKRMSQLNTGDPVTNVCAGDSNPMRHAVFVEHKIKRRKNRWGIVHSGHTARVTYGKKKFANINIEVIFPGHLGIEESKVLYAPIWERQFGMKQP